MFPSSGFRVLGSGFKKVGEQGSGTGKGSDQKGADGKGGSGGKVYHGPQYEP